jgi:hypothetical protein
MIVSFITNSLFPSIVFASALTILFGFYMTRHLVYTRMEGINPILKSPIFFAYACITDRFLLGSIYILEALRTQLSFIREFAIGFNGISVSNPSPESNKNTLSSNMLGHALKFMNTASRVSTRVQGNITREVGTEVYNTFITPTITPQRKDTGTDRSRIAAPTAAFQQNCGTPTAQLSRFPGNSDGELGSGAPRSYSEAVRANHTRVSHTHTHAACTIAPWEESDEEAEEAEEKVLGGVLNIVGVEEDGEDGEVEEEECLAQATQLQVDDVVDSFLENYVTMKT